MIDCESTNDERQNSLTWNFSGRENGMLKMSAGILHSTCCVPELHFALFFSRAIHLSQAGIFMVGENNRKMATQNLELHTEVGTAIYTLRLDMSIASAHVSRV